MQAVSKISGQKSSSSRSNVIIEEEHPSLRCVCVYSVSFLQLNWTLSFSLCERSPWRLFTVLTGPCYYEKERDVYVDTHTAHWAAHHAGHIQVYRSGKKEKPPRRQYKSLSMYRKKERIDPAEQYHSTQHAATISFGFFFFPAAAFAAAANSRKKKQRTTFVGFFFFFFLSAAHNNPLVAHTYGQKRIKIKSATLPATL